MHCIQILSNLVEKTHFLDLYSHQKLISELYTTGHSLQGAFAFRWIIMPPELYSAHTFPASKSKDGWKDRFLN